MNPVVAADYKRDAATRQNVQVVEEGNILKSLIMADVMISDTSSVVYEFILLNKPVITINSASQKHYLEQYFKLRKGLEHALIQELTEDRFREKRQFTIREYHPYTDGKSSARMVTAVEEYIARYGVPERRSLNLYRRFKMNNMFGSEPTS
jgi:CDP-ribitol ribitolphosphotransferase